MSINAMKQALEALENSVDLVQHEYTDAVELYGKYPTRAAKIDGLLALQKAHEDSITALRQAIEVAEKADKEAGFEMWWGEFMPSAFRNRAWEAWSMAHPKVEQAEKVEPVAWLVCFDGRIGGARVTDKLVIWRKEQAEQQVRAELIQSVEPLYTRIKS
jgi:hypothetical protein